MRCRIRHRGVVIGAVDLPEGRHWAGGLLEPARAFDTVRPMIEAATHDTAVALRLLTLPLGQAPAVDDLAPALARAVTVLAAQEFELIDARSRVVPTEVVRLADPGPRERVRGVRVRAHFRLQPAPVPATR